jgi:hypothetical protein
MVFDGGYVSDVVLSNLTIECTRHDWFWWGDGDPLHFNIKRRSEVHTNVSRENEPRAGSIRNVLIKNVIARGKGPSVINGHPESWLDGVTIENLKLFLSSDPKAYHEKAVNCLKFEMAKNLKLKDIEVIWDKPESDKWESALYLEKIKGLELDGFCGRQAKFGSEKPAVVLNQVEGAVIRNCQAAAGTGEFLHFEGKDSKDIVLLGNDFRQAKIPYSLGPEVRKDAIRALSNIFVKK